MQRGIQIAEVRVNSRRSAALIDRLGLSLSLVILAIGVIALGVRNLGARFFWFDDAGQFWMSQGQAHGTTFGTPQQSLQTGIEIARNGSNADPPGFTALLRLWTEGVGTSAAGLRAFPLFIILLAGIVSYWMGRTSFRLPRTAALLIPAIVLSNGLPLYYSLELRAFTAEILTVVALAAVSFAYLKRPKRYLLVVLAVSLLLLPATSRYSTVAAIGAVCLLFLAAGLLRRKKADFVALVTVSATALLSLIFLAWYAQVGNGGLVGPDYVDDIELSGNFSVPFVADVLLHNFWHGQNVFTGLFILLSTLTLVLAGWTGRRSREKAPVEGSKHHMPTWIWALFFIISYEVLTALLSVVGLSPWYSPTRWSIGLVAIAIISGFALLDLTRQIWHRHQLPGYLEPAQLQPFLTSLLVVATTFSVIRATWNPSLIPLIALSALSTLVVLLMKYLFDKQHSGKWSTEHKNDLDTQSRLVFISMLALVTVVMSTWISFGKLANFTSNGLRSPFTMAVEQAATSIPRTSEQVWLVHRRLWPGYRMLWETDIRETMVSPVPAVARAVGPSIVPSDREIAEALSRELRCTPATASFVYLLGDLDDWQAAVRQAESFASRNDCTAVIEQVSDKELLITVRS